MLRDPYFAHANPDRHHAHTYCELEVVLLQVPKFNLLTDLRWIYYIFLILMFFAILLQVAFYRPPNFRQLHGDDRTRMEEVKRIDMVGIFLLVAGLTLFLLGVSWGT